MALSFELGDLNDFFCSNNRAARLHCGLSKMRGWCVVIFAVELTILWAVLNMQRCDTLCPNCTYPIWIPRSAFLGDSSVNPGHSNQSTAPVVIQKTETLLPWLMEGCTTKPAKPRKMIPQAVPLGEIVGKMCSWNAHPEKKQKQNIFSMYLVPSQLQFHKKNSCKSLVLTKHTRQNQPSSKSGQFNQSAI